MKASAETGGVAPEEPDIFVDGDGDWGKRKYAARDMRRTKKEAIRMSNVLFGGFVSGLLFRGDIATLYSSLNALPLRNFLFCDLHS